MHLMKSLGIRAASKPPPREAGESGVHCLSLGEPLGSSVKRVLIADANASWREWLARGFRALGIESNQSESVGEICAIAQHNFPDIVIFELNFRDGTWFDAFSAVRDTAPKARTLVVTSSGSIASAVEAVRCGVTGYLVKPVTAEEILKAVEPGYAPQVERTSVGMSLDRAIWEYLTQTVAACGSIAGAARVLGLDRRSLRRMLSKNPPCR